MAPIRRKVLAVKVVVINAGSGNLNSLARALVEAASLEGVVSTVQTTRNVEVIRQADRVVLPGQGAFAACRASLSEVPGMDEVLNEVGRRRARPFLGICVGMQLLAERGMEHVETAGLGWLPGYIAQMDPRGTEGEPLPLPQMGWNRLDQQSPHPFFTGIPAAAHGYFVHSYAWAGGLESDLLATSGYGGRVAAVVGRDNILGTQFHVEKSGSTGLRMLGNFLRWSP